MSLWTRGAAKCPMKTHTNKQTALFVARLTIHCCLVPSQHAPLSYSDVSRQLNTLTLPFLTSVTWHSHLWLPLHTLKPINSLSPKTHRNTGQIYTMQNTYSFEEKDTTARRAGLTVFWERHRKTRLCMCVLELCYTCGVDCKNKNMQQWLQRLKSFCKSFWKIFI